MKPINPAFRAIDIAALGLRVRALDKDDSDPGSWSAPSPNASRNFRPPTILAQIDQANSTSQTTYHTLMKLTPSSKFMAAVCTMAITQLTLSSQAAKPIPGVAEQPAAYFYTGKPYDSDLGSYTFNARNYNPEVNRWTSADPSGFPDGTNGYKYVESPNFQVDALGLWITGTDYGPYGFMDDRDRAVASGAPAYFSARGATLSETLVSRYINATTATISNYQIDTATQAAIVANSGFEAARTYVDNWLSQGSDWQGNYDNSYATIFGIVNPVDLGSDYDLGHSIGHFDAQLSGTITPVWDSSLNVWGYSGSLNVAFTDAYDFALGGGWQTDTFARLQSNGWTTTFSTTGNWDVTFYGSFE